MVFIPPLSSETPVFAPPNEPTLDGNQQLDAEAQVESGPRSTDRVLPEPSDSQVARNLKSGSARKLNRRQVQLMIAIGNFFLVSSLNFTSAAIRNGFLIQSGQALYLGGPVCLLLAYIFIGTVMYSIMVRYAVLLI
jgi:amino acid permease